jgi:hypothetical protein
MANPDKVELRGLCDTSTAQMLDALAISEGVSRNDYVNSVLHDHCKEKGHKTMILGRMLKGNPYLTEDVGGALS